MPKAARLWHLTVAAVSLAVALSICALIAGGVVNALKEPVMLLWLLFSSALFYLVAVGFSGRFAEVQTILGRDRGTRAGAGLLSDPDCESSDELPPASVGEEVAESESPAALTVALSNRVEIGQVFYHDGREDSSLKPGTLSFLNGVLSFRGEVELVIDMLAGMQRLGDIYLCVIDDDTYDNPVYGKRDPVRVVRILRTQCLHEPVATFLMPIGPARLTDAVVKEYVEKRTEELEQIRSLLLKSVAEVVGEWSTSTKALATIKAFLGKVDSKPFINPACLMSFEMRMRTKLLDGHLGSPLLWTSAFEVRWLDRGQAVSLDLLPAEARAFDYESFRYLVRLLQRDCPLSKSFPELANCLATWLLLREAAVSHFAAAMQAELGEEAVGDIKQLIAAYVGKFAEGAAMQDENLSSLAYLLVDRGLLTAPMIYGDLGYHEEHNILLIFDAVKAHVANALEEKRLDRFAERLFV